MLRLSSIHVARAILFRLGKSCAWGRVISSIGVWSAFGGCVRVLPSRWRSKLRMRCKVTCRPSLCGASDEYRRVEGKLLGSRVQNIVIALTLVRLRFSGLRIARNSIRRFNAWHGRCIPDSRNHGAWAKPSSSLADNKLTPTIVAHDFHCVQECPVRCWGKCLWSQE